MIAAATLAVVIAVIAATFWSSSSGTGRVPVAGQSAPPTTAPVSNSASTTTTTAPVAPLAGKTIVIDPGHNERNGSHTAEISQLVDVITEKKACDEVGAQTNDGYTEATFTTDVANRLADRLRSRGARVVLTRDATTPFGPCVTQRAAIGNAAGADVAISLHADGGPATGRGFHVIAPLLVTGHNDAIIEPSHRFAIILRDTYAAGTGVPTADYIAHNGIDERDDLGGLNLSTVPKVFLECANMRNSTDAALLENAMFRDQIADTITRAIEIFLTGPAAG